MEPRPLAAGTIAQVHRASLATGQKVVIRSSVPTPSIEQDLALLEVFAEKAAKRPSLKLAIDMEAVFQHLSDSLQRELDFRQEASNMQRIGECSSRSRGSRCPRSTTTCRRRAFS